MDHVYERTWCDTDALTIVVGETSELFDLRFPPAGRITKLIVKQSGGTPVGFTVTLYSRDVASQVESSSSAGAECESEIYKICPDFSAAAGDTVTYYGLFPGYHYRNTEGSISVPVRKIYLLITLDNPVAVETYWDVVIACVPHI